MSVSQATSLAIQSSCDWCLKIRDFLSTTLRNFSDGLVAGRQMQANYHVAKQLAGRGTYKHMTFAEVFRVINDKTL